MWKQNSIIRMFNILFLNQMHHDGNLAVLFLTVIQVVYAIGILFISCELCYRISHAFDECSGMFDQLSWYRFPANIQRMLPMILHFTQQPIRIKLFGSSACNRVTFKYVSMNEDKKQTRFTINFNVTNRIDTLM